MDPDQRSLDRDHDKLVTPVYFTGWFDGQVMHGFAQDLVKIYNNSSGNDVFEGRDYKQLFNCFVTWPASRGRPKMARGS